MNKIKTLRRLTMKYYDAHSNVYDLAGARLLRDAERAMEHIEKVCELDPEFGAVFNAVLEHDITVHEYTDDDVWSNEVEWFRGPGFYYEKFNPKTWKMAIDPIGPFHTEKEAYYQAYEDYGLVGDIKAIMD